MELSLNGVGTFVKGGVFRVGKRDGGSVLFEGRIVGDMLGTSVSSIERSNVGGKEGGKEGSEEGDVVCNENEYEKEKEYE